MTALTTVGKVPYPLGTDPIGQADLHQKAIADWLEAWQVNRAKVYPGATANTINNGVQTTVSFGSESYDPGAMHSTVTNPSRITASKAGRYRVTAQIGWPSNATGWRYAVLIHNGVTSFGGTVMNAVNGAFTGQQVTGTHLFAANDYVVLQCSQNSGANLALDAAVTGTWLEAEWLGPV